ncbi:MAG: AAA family ATPase, partial [Betaproteobacteria bacterium]
MKEMFAKASAAAPAVLFLDEIDAVAAKRGGPNSDQFSKDIVNEMLAQMDGAKQDDRPVFVLAATNHLEHIDDALKSRFTELIEIPLPDEAGRTQILHGLISDRDIEPGLDVAELSATLAKRLPNRSGRDLKKLVERAMSRAMRSEDEHLTRALLMAEATPRGREVPEEELQRVWSKIVLKAEVKDALLSKIRLFNSAGEAAPRGLLLYGPPGTGKTQIAQRIAESCGGKFIALTASDLKGSVIGETAKRVKETWVKARTHGRCVMFIDECEGVFARRGGVNTDSFAEELVREFIALWDGVASEGQIWVVGATNRREDLDAAVISRFGTPVEIGLPDAAERQQIVALELRKLGREENPPDLVGRTTTGMAGRDLAQLARDVFGAAVERKSAELTPEIWREAIARLATAGSDAADDSARWDTLVLTDDTLQQLKTVCEGMRHMESLQQQGIEPPRGALLFGPPGTGKTQIARTLANEAGVAFIAAGPSDIKAGFIGQSGIKLRELFERARAKAPSILFIDEIDSVASTRGDANGVTNDEVVNEMLAQMDGVKKNSRPVFVLAATNHPEKLDAAIKSRFTYQIEIPNPDQAQRERLLAIFLGGKRQVDFDIVATAAELAARTNGLGGRDLQSLVRRAEQRAVQRALAAGIPERVVLSRVDIDAQLAPQGKEVSETELQAQWHQVVLKPAIKDAVMGKLRLFNRADKAAPKGLLLYGPPGTGKTEIARRMAASSSSRFMALTAADLKGAHIGQTAQKVKAVWEQARASGRCILFIDECEGVFARRGGTATDSFAEELVREFIAAWDGMASGGQVWVVGATNRLDQLDDAVLSRFGDPLEIGLPDAAERQQILRLEMVKMGRTEPVPDFIGREANGL